MKSRIRKMTTAAVILIAAGLLYLIINRCTGFAIPCVFHLVTGLNCPGCGISGMFVSLSQLDFAGAFKHNSAIMAASPVILYLSLALMIKYIKTGKIAPTKFQNVLLYILIAYFIIFAILRNIPAFDFLAPY